MAHDDPAQRRADERVPDRESVDAREPEDHLDVVGLERLDEDVSSGAHGGGATVTPGETYFWEAEMNATRSLMSDADSDDPKVVGMTPSAVPRGDIRAGIDDRRLDERVQRLAGLLAVAGQAVEVRPTAPVVPAAASVWQLPQPARR